MLARVAASKVVLLRGSRIGRAPKQALHDAQVEAEMMRRTQLLVGDRV